MKRSVRLMAVGALVMALILVLTGAPGASIGNPSVAQAVPAAYKGILLTKTEIDGLSTTSTAWTTLKGDADALTVASVVPEDQNNRGCSHTMAAGLVYLRTGTASYAQKVRDVLTNITTHNYNVGNGTLALGRNLQACVIAADLINLPAFDASANTTFTTWLRDIRTRDLPASHSRWYTLRRTCWNSANNWGTHACASLIAANWYLGDTGEVDFLWNVYQSWLGDRAKYPQPPASDNWGTYFQPTQDQDPTYFCNAANWIPVNPVGCTLAGGFNGDGSLGEETGRSVGPCCPPDDTGWQYHVTGMRGALASAEMLHRLGKTVYPLQSNAQKRMLDFAVRNNQYPRSTVNNWMSWVINFHYGSSYATFVTPATGDVGYNLAYGDWVWGPGRIESLPGGGGPTPTPTRTPAPTATRTPTPTPTPTGGRISETFATSAANFTTFGGTWGVVNGTYQITTSSTAATTHLNNRSVHNTVISGDFTLTADASATATGLWDDFAVIFGWQDGNNYYFASANEQNNTGTSGIFKVVGGTATELADVTSPITHGTTYALRVERTGGTIRFSRNGTLLATATDSTFLSGKVGFGSKDNKATFDNLVVP